MNGNLIRFNLASYRSLRYMNLWQKSYASKTQKISEFFASASPCSIKVWPLIEFYNILFILFRVLTYFFNLANTNSKETKQGQYGYIN